LERQKTQARRRARAQKKQAQERAQTQEQAQEQVNSGNISATNRTDSSDDSGYGERYQLSNRKLPFSISSLFQRNDNFIQRDDETDIEYKQRLERAVNIIEGTQQSTNNKREIDDKQDIINILNEEIKRLNTITPQQITNTTLNDLARTMANRTIPESAGPQVLTPAQLERLKKTRRQRERKFAQSQSRKTTAEKTAEIVTEALMPEVKGTRQNLTNYEIRRQEAEAEATEQRNLMIQRQEVIQRGLDRRLDEIKNIFGQLQPQVDRVRRAIENKRPEVKEAKRILRDSQISDVVNAIPSEYRGLLGNPVNQMLSGTFDLDTIAVGMVGLVTFMATGSPLVSQLTEPISRYLLNAFNINLNDYLYEPPRPITVYDSEVKRQLGTTTTEPNTETKQEQKQQLGVLSDYTKLRTDDVSGDVYLSDSDIGLGNLLNNTETKNMINELEDELLVNVANSTEFKIPLQEQQLIQTEARNYIREQFSRFISAIREQITRRDTTLYDLLQFNDEVVTPLGFFDYLNNLRGLPDAVRRNLPSVGLQELKDAMPVMMDIKRSIPRLPQLPMPERFRDLMPSRDELKEGAAAGIGGGVIPGIIGGGAMGAVGGIISGGLGGTLTAATISPLIRRYYEQQGLDMNDPEVKRNIERLQALPPTIAGALLGYSGVGEGIFSGAGITERKITVDPSVLAETKGVDQQEGKDPKKWATKAIMPTPDILDETQQEKFVSDLEFSMFNYVEPGSEGANGNIKTNPLKRSQFLTDQIRYTNAGISTPSMLYNVEFPTNTPQKQMDTYKLGQDMLPEMEFLVDDNANTFTPIGRHYPNNEDVAVEMFSPFSNFSDVRNFWAINRKSDLYNLYA
jgi:hypothetical protein